MSATISLKQSMARSTDAALNLFQYILIIAGLFFVFGIFNIISSKTLPDTQPVANMKVDLPDFALPADFPEAVPETLPPAPAPIAAVATPVAPTATMLSPSMQGALDYVKRRYRVSPEALVPVFEMAQLIGKERHIDPLLIVAVIGIESRFNPFAESAMGAQGLMQVVPRFHRDKLPAGKGDRPLLDPAVNIRVGVHVLSDAIRRGGGLVAGLQGYAGSSEPEGDYANKVLAEKERLEQAARRGASPNA